MSIIVGTDFSEASRGAVRYAADLAHRRNAPLVVVHVVDLAASDNSWRVLFEAPDEIERASLEEARQNLARFFEQSVPSASSPAAVRLVARMGNPLDVLLEEARFQAAEVVVAGTTGHTPLQHFFLGSTAHQLVRQSELPLALVPPGVELAEIGTILAPVDFSHGSLQSLEAAAKLARENGAKLVIMHAFVLPELALLPASTAEVSEQLKLLEAGKRQQILEWSSAVNLDGLAYELRIVQQAPPVAIEETAREVGAQLIVMSSHGRRGWARFFLGNTAEKLLRRAPCVVWTVRGQEPEVG